MIRSSRRRTLDGPRRTGGPPGGFGGCTGEMRAFRLTKPFLIVPVRLRMALTGHPTGRQGQGECACSLRSSLARARACLKKEKNELYPPSRPPRGEAVVP